MSRYLIIFLFSLSLLLPFAEAEIDYRWEAVEEDTNPFIEPLIFYQEKNVLFQDASLIFYISNSSYYSDNLRLRTINGTFALMIDDNYDFYVEMEDEFYRSWREGLDDEIISSETLNDSQRAGFILWPDLLDRDFWVEIELTFTSNGREVYREHHRIFVVGQPQMIEGSDFDVSARVLRTYGISAAVSIVFWGTIALIAIISRMGRKGGGAR